MCVIKYHAYMNNTNLNLCSLCLMTIVFDQNITLDPETLNSNYKTVLRKYVR